MDDDINIVALTLPFDLVVRDLTARLATSTN
jgi:hypothetical protein